MAPMTLERAQWMEMVTPLQGCLFVQTPFVQAALDTAKQACGTQQVPVNGDHTVLIQSAQKTMTIRRKELVDHCGEHGY